MVHFLECSGVRSDTSKLENYGAPKCALNGVCANFYQLNEFVSSTLSGRAGRHMFFSLSSPALQHSPRLLRASHVDGTSLGPPGPPAAPELSQMIGAVGAQTRPKFEFCARPKCTDWNKTRIFALVQLIAINATTLPPIKRRWPYGPGVRSPFS